VIYCVSAPLWNSRQGHHKSHIFDVNRYPWLHLRFDKETIKTMLHNGEINYPDSLSLPEVEAHVDDMMNQEIINQVASYNYLDVTNSLNDVIIIHNSLDLENESNVDINILNELLDRGYTKTELLAITHTFIATKRIPQYDLESENKGLKYELSQAHQMLDEANNIIYAMQTSKFWKIRSFWFNLKKNLGLLAK
jgi:hypothetical protein